MKKHIKLLAAILVVMFAMSGCNNPRIVKKPVLPSPQMVFVK